MMKNAIIILLVLFSYASFGQGRPSQLPVPNAPSGYYKIAWIRGDSAFIFPNFSDTGLYLPAFPFTTIGRRTISDTSLYFWTGARWKQVGSSSGSGTLTGAINGTSVSGTNVILGQAYGAGGNPGALTQNTDIPMSGDTLRLSDGYLRVRSGQGGGLPPVTIENTFPGASENLHIIGDLSSIRMLATGASPYAAISQYAGSGFGGTAFKNSYGYDGPANHVFLCDLRNSVNSATFEINGATLAGFSGLTGNLWGGQGVVPDTAALNLFRVGTALTSPSQQMLLYGGNYGATYNTTSGAIINRMAFLDNSATRSTGGNALTNTALFIRARGAQNNYGLFVDSGDVVIGSVFDATASTNNCNLYTVSNTTSTQKRIQENISRTIFYNDTLAGSEPNGSSSLKVPTRYDAKALMTIPDNISGSSAEISMFLRRRSTYSGATVFQGSTLPTNDVTTMPSVLNVRFDQSQAQTGGNSVRMQGHWSGITSWVAMNTGNSFGKYAWINTGAVQATGGTIDTGYAIYINTLPSLVTQKYAMRQEGSADSVYLGGVTRHPNLSTQTDTTNFKPMVVSANGTVSRLNAWPAAGSSGATNISVSPGYFKDTVKSSTGTSGLLDLATKTNAGSMSPSALDIYSMPEIKLYIAGVGVAAPNALANYPATSVDSVYYAFSTTRAGSSGTEFGGVLWNGSGGDSAQVRVPYCVGIGNSIFEGHPGLHGRLHPLVSGVAQNTFIPAYPDSAGQLSYELRALTHMRWYNHGIGGQTTTQIRQRFARDVLALQNGTFADSRGNVTLSYKPTIVVIECGINDVAAGVDPETIKDNLRWMVDQCKRNNIVPVVFNLPGDAVTNQTFLRGIETINKWMAAGGLGENCTVFDFNAWWGNATYRNLAYNLTDNTHPNANIADDIHPTKAGYADLANVLFLQAKLPVLTKAIFLNNIDPAGFTGYQRPSGITINGNAFTLGGQVDSVNITSFTPDSVWIKTTSVVNVSGTSTYGFSHILWKLDNNVGDTLKFTRRLAIGGSYESEPSVTSVKIIPTSQASSKIIDAYLANMTDHAIQATTTGAGVQLVLNGLSNTAAINNAALSIYPFGSVAIGTTGNIISTGTSSQIANMQLQSGARATGTGYGIGANFSGVAGMAFDVNNNLGGRDQFLFGFFQGGLTAALGTNRSTVVHIAGGFGNSGGINQIGTTLAIEPIYNNTQSNAGAQITGIRYGPTLTSLTSTKHRSANILTGDWYANTVSDNFAIGLDSNATIGAKLHVSGTVRLDGMLVGNAGSPLLVKDADSIIRQIPQSSLTGVSNIYNNNGTLAGNRTVTGSSNSLTLDAINNFRVNSTSMVWAKNNGTFAYSTLIGATADNNLQLAYTPTALNFSKGTAIRIDTNNSVMIGSTLTVSFPLYATGGVLYAGDGLISRAGNFYRVRDITADANILTTDNFITVDATAGNVTLTLPAASGVFGGTVGIRYVFKRLDASGNTITVQRNGTPGTDTIDGAANFTIVGQYTVKEVQCISSSVYAIK